MYSSKFQTIVDIPSFPWKTGYDKKHLFMGSCFTENVGTRMAALKYQVDINPLGILYNPMSVASGLEILLSHREFSASDLIEHNGMWHSFSHHGRFSSVKADDVLEKINSRIKSSCAFLLEADYLLITFGTAWVYRYKKNGEVVSNCHKVPAREFIRERISVDEIVRKYTGLLQLILEQNPKLKVIFTVSPIRHWKDGAVENQRSKAILLLAVDELVKNLGSSYVAYFPSYEIVMDELRDYRFYAEDMLHLSDVAVNHIWNIFEQCLIEEESRLASVEVKKIVSAVNHRPINRESEEFFKFLISFQKKLAEIEGRMPFLNLRLEKEYFAAQINEFKQKG